MELSKYIKEILISRENVIVSGFGAFEKSLESAKIDPITKEMHPPMISVIFRPELKVDSGVLTKYVAEKENVTEEKAAELINNQVAEWENTLQSGQSVELPTLGTLSKNKNGEYAFVPQVQASDFPESYGLPVIPILDKSTTVEQPTKKTEEKKTVEKKPIEKKPVEKSNPTQKKSVQPAKKTEGPTKTKSHKKLIVGLIIGLPLAAVIVLGALNFNLVKQKFNSVSNYVSSIFKSEPSENKPDTAIQQKKDSLGTVSDSTSRATETVLENYTIVNSETNAKLEPKMSDLGNVKKVYLIAGSYKIREYAVKRRNQLNKKGFTSEVLPLNHGLYRVSISSFADINSATKDIGRIKSIDESLDVWILVNK